MLMWPRKPRQCIIEIPVDARLHDSHANLAVSTTLTHALASRMLHVCRRYIVKSSVTLRALFGGS